MEFVMNLKRNALVAAIGTALTLSTIVNASADTRWQRHHPRREEVNHRLSHQDKRVNTERREGEITAQQAHNLHKEDRSIRNQERFDARLDNGHITRTEKHALNQEENGVSKQIGQ